MEILVNWFRDPVVQGLVLSPLIGAVLGVILGMMVQPPPTSAPVHVRETRVVFIHRIESRPRQTDDGSWVLFAAVTLVLGLTWIYARWGIVGVEWWAYSAFLFLAFNFGAAIVSLLRRTLTSDWLFYIALPAAALLFCLWLAVQAKANILPGAQEASARSGVVEFYFLLLNSEQRAWLLTQSLGVLTGTAATVLSAMRLTHYVALSNQRSSGWWATAWRFVAYVTNASAGPAGLFLMVFSGLAAWLLIDGHAYRLMVSHY